jgi:hypothetical protein
MLVADRKGCRGNAHVPPHHKHHHYKTLHGSATTRSLRRARTPTRSCMCACATAARTPSAARCVLSTSSLRGFERPAQPGRCCCVRIRGFGNKKVCARLRAQGCAYSIIVPMHKIVSAQIALIANDAWQPRRLPRLGCLRSGRDDARRRPLDRASRASARPGRADRAVELLAPSRVHHQPPQRKPRHTVHHHLDGFPATVRIVRARHPLVGRELALMGWMRRRGAVRARRAA